MVTLDNGKKVYIDSFHSGITYSGWIIGNPYHTEANEYEIESIRRTAEKVWGQRATHVIRPQCHSDPEGEKALPAYKCAVWLLGPPKGDACGSQLVVIFFTDSLYDRPLEQVIEEAVHDIEWEKLAEDYDP